jgi:hypothetical protein
VIDNKDRNRYQSMLPAQTLKRVQKKPQKQTSDQLQETSASATPGISRLSERELIIGRTDTPRGAVSQ